GTCGRWMARPWCRMSCVSIRGCAGVRARRAPLPRAAAPRGSCRRLPWGLGSRGGGRAKVRRYPWHPAVQRGGGGTDETDVVGGVHGCTGWGGVARGLGAAGGGAAASRVCAGAQKSEAAYRRGRQTQGGGEV